MNINWTRETPNESDNGKYFIIQHIGTKNVQIVRWNSASEIFVNVHHPNFYKPIDKRLIWFRFDLYEGKMNESVRDEILCLI